ncbi:GPI-anchored surface protein, putative [Bodo saltans]|uniref:GPI-anchored surface protein, putative n=1 Tax=Bodo saltans TaxID=75058 RepID=A0A0S4IYP2_BODSA|nr:GPI-anchored surface protein, putative [Bodo saltans]|eukprot:CUG58154.1 GPI-anchored surface protein, putative [Bodo saltans]
MDSFTNDGSPPVTFSFLTSWGLLEQTCEAVPVGTPEERSHYHHCCPPPPPPLVEKPKSAHINSAPTEHQRRRGRGVRGGAARGGRRREPHHHDNYETIDVDELAHDEEAEMAAHEDGMMCDNAAAPPPINSTPEAQPLPLEVICVVHFLDHVAQRGRTESFPMPIASSASELYDTVRWWLGDERIVLFDVQYNSSSDPPTKDTKRDALSSQGIVANVVLPHQPIGLLTMHQDEGDNAAGDGSGPSLHPMCITVIPHASDHHHVSASPRHKTNQRRTSSVVYRRIACQRTTSRVEDVLHWAAVYTFIPQGHGSASEVAWGLPPVVVPVFERGHVVEIDNDRDLNNWISQRALVGAGTVVCATYRARQCYSRCPALVTNRGTISQTVLLTEGAPAGTSIAAATCAPAEVLVGYPACTVGDVVEIVAPLTSSRTTVASINTTAALRSVVQITEATVSEHSGLQLFYTRDIHTNAHQGPFLCSQLGVLGLIDSS